MDENFRIADGQHRFTAAKKLRIPIFYIQKPGITYEEIVRRNAHISKWSQKDYFDTRRDKNENYRTICEIMDRYYVDISHLLTICLIMDGGSSDEFQKKIKDGTFDLSKYRTKFLIFCEVYFNFLDRVKKSRDLKFISAFKSRTYLQCFVDIFEDSPEKLDNLFERILVWPANFPSFRNKQDAMNHINLVLKKRKLF